MSHQSYSPYISSSLIHLISKSNSFCCQSQLPVLETSDTSFNLKNREIILNWLIETSEYFSSSSKPIHLSMSYIDLFTRLKPVPDIRSLELLTYACFFLSLAFETSRQVSETEIIKAISHKFSIKSLRTTQVYVLETLGWALDHPTALEIMQLLLIDTCEDVDILRISPKIESFIFFVISELPVFQVNLTCLAVAASIFYYKKSKKAEFAERWEKKVCGKFDVSRERVAELIEFIEKKFLRCKFQDFSVCI